MTGKRVQVGVLGILEAELARALSLLGVASVDALTPAVLADYEAARANQALDIG